MAAGWRCLALLAGGSPAATHFLCFAKESKQRKATPAVCDPFASLRGTLRYSLQAGSAQTRLRLKQRAALIRLKLRSSAQTEGAREWNTKTNTNTNTNTNSQTAKQPNSQTAKQPNSQPGHYCARPSLRSARRLRPSGLGRAQQWPVWMSGFGFPSGCAEERRFWRIRARVCLSDAKRREFSETPTKLSTAGCPQRSEGTQPAGSLFLGLLSFGEAKESESPAGAKSRPPP